MKQFSLMLAVILIMSCGIRRKVKSSAEFAAKTDTIALVYVQNGTYTLARALRIIGRQAKITDSVDKKWDFVIDTSYVVEVPVIPLDTLRDSLHHIELDSITHNPLIRKSFTAIVHTPLPPFFWPLTH